ncbi:TULIP family P47-like protein [Granulicella sp. dw_53]|uniref:TULIP family P47-like protein n=1 Tax=Granulicella sp. dw_53 TaxID=2719792 RepID=UPI001BD4F24C|nr:TULIP family P47-like protein [Granulicella sp. dw_53]
MSTDFRDGETSTLGWDSSFAICLKDVNAAIAKDKRWPTSFEILIDPQEDYAMKGTFGPWQMTQGGSGGIVMLAIPIATGAMTISQDGSIVSYPMDGSVAIVSVKLRYVTAPLSAQPLESSTERMSLMTDPQARSVADPAVVLHGFEFLDPAPSPYVQLLMKAGMETWFNDNIALFAHVFAVVSLNDVSGGAFQWLKPTYSAYAYLDGATEEDSFFGVISMTENRSVAGLANQLGPNCVPKGSPAGFTIGMARYLEKVMLPSLTKAFSNATTSTFTLVANNRLIVNTESFKLNPVKVNGTSYTPQLEIFEAQVLGEEMQIHVRTKIPISPGIRAMVDSVAYQKIVLVQKPDGGQTLDFKDGRPTATNHWIEVDDGVKITQIVVSIVGAVAGVAAEAFEATAKVILAAVLITIVAGVASLIPDLIAEVAGGGAAAVLPPIGGFAQGATGTVQWPDAGQFELAQAGLNGAFQFGGTLQFTF